MYRSIVVFCTIALTITLFSESMVNPIHNMNKPGESFTIPKPSPNVREKIQQVHNLIDCSLWTLFMSKQISDSEAKNAAQQVYAYSMDEIDKNSSIVAEEIVRDIIENDCDALFHEFCDSFKSSSENMKSGYYALAKNIEDKLLDHRSKSVKHYLGAIQEVVACAISSNVTFSEYSIGFEKMIDKYGRLVVTYHASAIHEYVVSDNPEQVLTKLKYIRKAFELYSWLNRKFCTSPTKENRESVQDVFDQAENAYYSNEYSEAISLYNQVIAMDSSYASQNGCYWRIGRCYEDMGQYETAVSKYKDSIRYDCLFRCNQTLNPVEPERSIRFGSNTLSATSLFLFPDYLTVRSVSNWTALFS